MAPASPISATTTLLRQSVVDSPSDRFRGGLTREPAWLVVRQNVAADSQSRRRNSTPQTTYRFCRAVSPFEVGHLWIVPSTHVLDVRRDVPGVAEDVLHSTAAVAVGLVDRLSNLGRSGLQRTPVNRIAIRHVQIEHCRHGRILPLSFAHLHN